ncbi:hypothetical protein [Streptomyces hydrogenans]|uniref:Uncharacterized protein n=1 Tax=Streptomyces hydrogenans TaxID=1873719 RepID=A0ABQ3PF18_9ACTN|nr:hypothetical protein [Streptomyces hydrogenans]GHG01005.1 hypothetical protein GCM10018784_10980 [Streptomyces hydrogenans]GHI23596.1 hypothetical protein Shyd_49670 [Streptomyces hydrogenans]
MTPLRPVLAVSGWLALLASVTLPDAAPVRVAAVTAFLLVCPGHAALLALRPARTRRSGHPADRLETALLTLVLGLALATLVAVTLFLCGVFTATRSLLVLAALTSVLALLPHRSGARNRDSRVHAG